MSYCHCHRVTTQLQLINIIIIIIIIVVHFIFVTNWRQFFSCYVLFLRLLRTDNET